MTSINPFDSISKNMRLDPLTGPGGVEQTGPQKEPQEAPEGGKSPVVETNETELVDISSMADDFDGSFDGSDFAYNGEESSDPSASVQGAEESGEADTQGNGEEMQEEFQKAMEEAAENFFNKQGNN